MYAPSGTFSRINSPLLLVAIPILVPINRTFAPMSAFPLLASITRPFSVICPNEVLTKANMNNVVSTAILFIIK